MIQDPRHNEINALVRLIEDPDPNVYENVSERLRSIGLPVVSILEEEWSRSENGLPHQGKIEKLIREIRIEDIKTDLHKWRESSNRDLLKGAMILNKFQYPNLDFANIEAEMEKISRMVWLEINDNNTAFEIVKVINYVLFEECGFTVSNSEFLAPRHSYIESLLKSKKGNQLSLAILYSIIAQRLKIPIYGVNFHTHFVLGFVDERQTLKMLGMAHDDRNILFYINPERKGKIFDHNEIENYLRNLNLPLQKDYFEPCSNSQILKMLIQNLTVSYSQAGEESKVEDLRQLQEILG
ncbi:MAG: transglutaminase-like domain-containing protein [Crocinitomicaceae bacterium]|nr:transglutaminase-like domain-containing protein [Crocinitomicaceae bacterium]